MTIFIFFKLKAELTWLTFYVYLHKKQRPAPLSKRLKAAFCGRNVGYKLVTLHTPSPLQQRCRYSVSTSDSIVDIGTSCYNGQKQLGLAENKHKSQSQQTKRFDMNTKMQQILK